MMRRPDSHLTRTRRRSIARGLAVATLWLPMSCKEPVDPNGGVHTRWLVDQVPTPSETRPSVSGRSVLFGTKDGTVVARDTGTGAQIWTSRIASPGDPVSGENMIISAGLAVIPVRFHVTAIDAATGTERWRYTTPLDTVDAGTKADPGYLVRTHIAADDKTVFIPAWGASVSAVDIQTGAVRWVWRGDSGVAHRSGSMGVAISGDTVIATAWHFTDANGAGNQAEAWVLGLDKLTGRELWRVVLTGPGFAGTLADTPPVLYGNLAIVGVGTGDLYAIDRGTRAIAWHVPSAGSAVFSGPAISGDTVYFDRGTGILSAFRAGNGTLLWSARFGELFKTDMLDTDRHLYAPSFGRLFIFDRMKGTLIASLKQPNTRSDGAVAGPVTASNGHVYAGVRGQAWSFDEPR